MPNGQTRACDVMNTDGSQIESDPNKMEGGGEYGWQGRVFRARNEADKDGHIPADNTAKGRFMNAPHESERHQRDHRDDQYQDDRYQDDRYRNDRNQNDGYRSDGNHGDRYRPY